MSMLSDITFRNPEQKLCRNSTVFEYAKGHPFTMYTQASKIQTIRMFVSISN